MASRRLARNRSLSSYLNNVNQTAVDAIIPTDMQNQLAVNSVDGNSMSESVTLINNILQSNNYVEGYAGWRITGNGKAEFENVSVRGNIDAYSGSIGYWNISTPAVTRVIGSQTLLGTFLESTGIGSDDEDETEGSYVALFKSYVPDPVVVTTKERTSNVATLTVVDHEYAVGDKITVSLEDDTSFNNGGIAVTITATTIDTFSYTNVGNNVTSSDALGESQLYNKDVAGLYLQDYSKALFDHGYFSNEGIKYVSAEVYNLVHNPSFEYLVSNTATYSNSGWAFGTNLVATQFDNASTVTVDSFTEDFLKDDLVYTSYSAKVAWGTNTLSSSYASTNVNYTLLHNLANLQKTLYFDFYAYFNPAGAAVSVTRIDRTSGSANVVLTASGHGLTVGEYVWNEFDYAVGEQQWVDAYVPLKIVAANATTFTVTVASAASTTANIAPPVRDRIYRLHPVAYDLTQINFKLPNANTITLYEVLADDTKATWDANAAYKFFSLPYQKDSLGNYALPYHGLDGSNNLVFYNLPRLAPISNTEGTAVPYEIKINASEFARLYAIRDNTGFTNKNNVELRFPGWIYRNEATPATKVATYSTTGIYLDNISLSTEKSFFYGGANIASQTWYDDASKPNTASVLSAKTWVNIDLDTQTSYLNHTDYVSFKSPLLKDKLVKNSGIYTINDVDNIDYKPINIGTSLVSDYSSLLFTSGEYEYKLADNTYANYESLVASRVEKDKAFLYLSTLYKNLDADGTYSASDPHKWEASIAMASDNTQNTEVSITGKLVSIQPPVTGDDTYFTVTGDQSISGNVTVGIDASIDNDLTVTNNIYVGGLTLSNTSDTQFARRAYTNTVTNLPTGTWYTIAYNPGGTNAVSIGRATAQFVLVDRQSGKHQSVHFMASATFGDPALTILHSSAFGSGAPFEAIRLKTFGTYDGAALQVYSNGSSSAVNAQAFMYANDQTVGAWELVDFIDDAEDPSTYGTTAMTNYANLVGKSELNLELGGGIAENKFLIDGSIVAANTTNSAIYTIIQPNAATFYGNVAVGNNLTVTGNLIVNGTTTTINSSIVTVDDINVVLGNVTSSSNTTANGGGLILEATTGGNKTLTWLSATGAWTSSEDFNLVTGKVYEINGSTVLSSTQVLGYSISSTNTANTIVLRNASGDFSARGITAQNSISIGLTDGTVNTPYIDFNAGATAVDYDSRIITTSGSGTTGQGNTIIYAGTLSVFGGLSGAPVYTVRGATSQTGHMQVWENSGGTDLAYVNKDGRISILAGSSDVLSTIPATLGLNSYVAGAVGIAVRGAASQTGDLQRWLASDDTTLAKIDKDGNFTANVVTADLAIGNVTGLGTNVSTFLQTPTSANFANAITGETGTGNVVFDTSALLVTPNVSGALKFIGNASNSVTFTVTGSASNQGNLVIDSGTTQIFGTLPAAPVFTVRGAALQTGNLQVWENSSGTDLAYMDKDGSLTANVFTGSGAGLTNLNGSNVASGLVGLAYGGTGSNTAPKAMATLMGYTSTVTAAGTTTLTNTSSYYQQFTGTSTQTVTLPVTSTLQTGWTFHIVNNSTGNVTVNSSGGNQVIVVIPGTTAMVTCIGTTLTTAADWESGLTDFSSYTGTGSVVFNTSPAFTTPNIGTPSFANLTNGSAYPVGSLANLGTNVATFLTTPSSANLRNAVTDEAGTGALVFRGSTTAATTDIATGWYTIAYASNTRAAAKFILTDTRSGIHQLVVFQASNNFHLDTAAGITVLQQSAYTLASAPLQKIRIKNGNVSTDGFVLQVYVDNATNSLAAYMYENDMPSGWTLPTNWVADATDPGVTAYANAAAVVEVNLDSGGAGKNQMLVTGDIYAGVNATSHVIASQAYSLATNTSYTLATNNTNQSMFPALSNGAAVESGFRYEIEGTVVISHTITTVTNGTVSDVLSTSFNTPTLTYGWMEYSYVTSTTATFAAGTTDTMVDDVVTTTITNDVVANSISRSLTGTNSGYIYIKFRGAIKTSAAGNVLPRVKFNYTDVGGVGTNSGAIQAGSWMRVTKVAETTSGWT